MQSFLAEFTKEIYVFFTSMVPVIELRGAIPMGIAIGLGTVKTFFVAVLGNILPIPFILFLARPIMAWLKKTKVFSPLVDALEKKIEKNRDRIMRYSAFGLFLFVAIPIPGTGAWTGALAAAMFDMRMKYALPGIILGVLTAGVIMCFGSNLVRLLINIF